MLRRRNLWRSVVAGVLIGFAEGTRLRVPPPVRPPCVVWLDDRRLTDPLEGVPLLLLDPVPLERGFGRDLRKRVYGLLRVSLPSPTAWLRRLSRDATSGSGHLAAGGAAGTRPQRWQRGQ